MHRLLFTKRKLSTSLSFILIHVLYFFKLPIVSSTEFVANCSLLQIGQYVCNSPDIDIETQQPRGCSKENIAIINCTTSDGILCLPGSGLDDKTFEKEIPCQNTNGYSFQTALFLSVFFGMFGFDRFYLGYPAIGLVKFCTLGFMFLGQLIDIILIALQVVKPSDGSNYIISYFGPGLTFVTMDNDTYIVPKDNW